MTLNVAITTVLKGFDLDVNFAAERGVTAIFGASGAGKTTVINAVAGLHRPDQGTITLDNDTFFAADRGINVPVADRRLGYVFQDHRLFPNMTVAQNLSFAKKARGLRQDGQHHSAVLEILGIAPLLGRYPTDLSGGEKQRVAIGRALLSQPKVLLLDEPLASLDHARRLEILPYLERLRDHSDLPILYVSHSVSEVARLANQVVLLDRGRQIQVGPVTEVFSDLDAAQFLGRDDHGAVLFAKVVATHADGVTEVQSSGGRLFVNQTVSSANKRIRLRIRAQDVMLSLSRPEGLSALNVLPCVIADIRSEAKNSVLVQLACGPDRLLSRITERSRQHLNLQIGMPIFAVLKTVSMAQEAIGFQAG
ncbi:molybdenum ABC transporter ATP-binding protein [Cognatishimia maritima]|uniref:Molybdate transport system ATP-binding protein n=1 Tax=Cognatishimia maritima TaxID=870908 RepID=A0A1M5UD24_9RHOB|nr:molybdenum ABC transporter ATP-binding protein [Cognatishimia maritima]SHH60952.1 molybdate transport system ATP-binding protein [Cognatishimia maritima]